MSESSDNKTSFSFFSNPNSSNSTSKRKKSTKVKELLICKRCNQIVDYIQTYQKDDRHVYYYAVHYDRASKRTYRCYLGPKLYDYVERLHGIGLRGLIENDRDRQYLLTLLSKLSENGFTVDDLIKVMLILSTILSKLVRTEEEKKRLMKLIDDFKKELEKIQV